MTTLQTYRRTLAERAGFFALSTTTAASTATNHLMLGLLADTDLEARHYNTVWSMVTSTNGGGAFGEVRRLSKNTFAPGTGSVQVSRALSTILSSGVEVEVHGVLPPIRQAGLMGWREVINTALRECWSVDTLNIAPATSTTLAHNLSTLPWIITEPDIIDVWVRSSGASVDSLVGQWRFNYDMNAPTLELRQTHSTGTAIKPKVYRPLDTWIAVNSTWANSTSGLVNDTDEALLPLEGMVRVGLAVAYEHLATRGGTENESYYMDQAATWRRRADAWKGQFLPRQAGRDSHWVGLTNARRGMTFEGSVG